MNYQIANSNNLIIYDRIIRNYNGNLLYYYKDVLLQQQSNGKKNDDFRLEFRLINGSSRLENLYIKSIKDIFQDNRIRFNWNNKWFRKLKNEHFSGTTVLELRCAGLLLDQWALFGSQIYTDDHLTLEFKNFEKLTTDHIVKFGYYADSNGYGAVTAEIPDHPASMVEYQVKTNKAGKAYEYCRKDHRYFFLSLAKTTL